MKPDGSGKGTTHFDEYHNWFPHISPDGKSMVFYIFSSRYQLDATHPIKKGCCGIMSLAALSAP